ncbi:hypothetical protein DR950_18230 [Kitasatospora xanthocidica]|uniref:Uncharacterized protein n=1 Tax=Kitasatospora xanthocidica TaxID=83382 RepID=A0A372ZUB4_9ACTN|nr:hypothetical protein [Kitasatospora xanthocidica]RGD59473.1 hypothetical protein DR950_18230 [Kitasatospora xanthocidica]
MGERETWTTDEFGDSHEGAVGVLLADGTVPRPAFFPSLSQGGGHTTSQWDVYDGRHGLTPRAHALRAVCSCGWTGPEHQVAWNGDDEQRFDEPADELAYLCEQEWDEHTTEVEKSAVAMPDDITDLIRILEDKLDKLGTESPLAAIRVVRMLELTAKRSASRPARIARYDLGIEQSAAGLGLSEDGARRLLSRFDLFSAYN